MSGPEKAIEAAHIVQEIVGWSRTITAGRKDAPRASVQLRRQFRLDRWAIEPDAASIEDHLQDASWLEPEMVENRLIGASLACRPASVND